MEGRASHGAGHPLCSADFYAALELFEASADLELPRCDATAPPCAGGSRPEEVERCYWRALLTIRKALADRPQTVECLASRLRRSRRRLDARAPQPRRGAPRLEAVYEAAAETSVPAQELRLEPGTATTLRGELGRSLDHLNQRSGGALLIASVELFDLLPTRDRLRIFPEDRAIRAMGITGFTLPTMYRWITSERGRKASLHPFKGNRFLGSGPGPMVLAQAGLDGESQYLVLKRFVEREEEENVQRSTFNVQR